MRPGVNEPAPGKAFASIFCNPLMFNAQVGGIDKKKRNRQKRTRAEVSKFLLF
jgi:hypothetical protein